MKLHYKSLGSGPPVVILHGLFGMLDNWQTFSRDFSLNHHIYSLDLRNHGRSPHIDEMSITSMADDIREFVQDHDLQHVTLIGHSLGGKVAMKTALSYPELVDHLIVIDIAPRAYAPAHETIIQVLQNTDLSLPRAEIERRMMNQLQDPGVVKFLVKNIARHEDGTLFWRMNLPVLIKQYQSTIEAITAEEPYPGPTLFVRGGRSQYIRDDDWSGILYLFPHAMLRTVEKAGHWVHADSKDELLQIVRAFLDEDGSQV